MNRIVVIGNGFDKAHGLATGYKDFIDDYWSVFAGHIFGGYSRWQTATYGYLARLDHYEDEFAEFKVEAYDLLQAISRMSVDRTNELWRKVMWDYSDINKFVHLLNNESIVREVVSLKFKNKFFEHISTRCYLTNWVDIENEYYEKLKELLIESDAETRHQRAKQLNQDFEAVKKLLKKYLIRIVAETNPSLISSLQESFRGLINLEEVAHSKRKVFFKSIRETLSIDDEFDMMNDEKKDANYLFMKKEDSSIYYIQKKLKTDDFKKRHCRPQNTLLLNFNYTNIAERIYTNEENEVIHIHGEFDNPHNPIIFGYGDELDDDYKQIEKLQDNDFLENIKSIRYHETGNYRNLLSFLEADLYQVVVMGHSCGNSDRTLLNTLLEHPNCASVKVYYHQIDENTDNYSQIVRNLSRNFNDKAAMRDKVVNKELCTPLVPIQKE